LLHRFFRFLCPRLPDQRLDPYALAPSTYSKPHVPTFTSRKMQQHSCELSAKMTVVSLCHALCSTTPHAPSHTSLRSRETQDLQAGPRTLRTACAASPRGLRGNFHCRHTLYMVNYNEYLSLSASSLFFGRKARIPKRCIFEPIRCFEPNSG